VLVREEVEKGPVQSPRFAKQNGNGEGRRKKIGKAFGSSFMGKRRLPGTCAYAKHMFFYLIFPATSIAAVLFDIFSNPRMKVGYNLDNDSYPSVSWFILFLCVRQAITFSLARANEMLMIDLVALKTRLMIRVVGPLITLVVVQSKGWQFMLTWWAIYDLCMLSGDGKFANHWMSYQDVVELFNDTNPSGNIPNSYWNFRILYVALILGLIVALKTFFMILVADSIVSMKRQLLSLQPQRHPHHLFRVVFAAIYGSKLAAVIHKMIVISQVAVAALARQLESEGSDQLTDTRCGTIHGSVFNWDYRGFDGLNNEEGEGSDDEGLAIPDNTAKLDLDSSEEESAAYSRVLSASETFRIAKMLEGWEEP
jgi:hypothetical protein